MARDDLFRRSFEAGTAFLDMTRERAEALVKELVKAGEVKKGKASKLIDEVLERSRRGTEELVQIIRREIGEQVSALGLATKEDLADLERRMAGGAANDAPGPAPATPAEPPATADPAEPATAGPATEVKPAGGEAQATGARAAAAGAKKAAKARAPRKKAAGSAPPPPDRPAEGGSGG